MYRNKVKEMQGPASGLTETLFGVRFRFETFLQIKEMWKAA
jgi:hypothetical protein